MGILNETIPTKQNQFHRVYKEFRDLKYPWPELGEAD